MVGELCPSCGGLLEPVASLAEIVGFRHITHRPDTADTDFAEAVAAALPRPPTAR
jgi:hypothetical protein